MRGRQRPPTGDRASCHLPILGAAACPHWGPLTGGLPLATTGTSTGHIGQVATCHDWGPLTGGLPLAHTGGCRLPRLGTTDWAGCHVPLTGISFLLCSLSSMLHHARRSPKASPHPVWTIMTRESVLVAARCLLRSSTSLSTPQDNPPSPPDP